MNDRVTVPRAQVFLLDDEPEMTAALKWLLDSVKIPSRIFTSPSEFLEAVQTADVPVCAVIDLRMPETSGLELQQMLLQRGLDIPLAFLSAHGDVPAAVNAMQHGAIDFFQKPFNPQEFLSSANRMLRLARERFEFRQRRREIEEQRQNLSSREKEILRHLVKGRTSKEIARLLEISSKTVDVHRANVLRKMRVKSVPELMRKLEKQGAD